MSTLEAVRKLAEQIKSEIDDPDPINRVNNKSKNLKLNELIEFLEYGMSKKDQPIFTSRESTRNVLLNFAQQFTYKYRAEEVINQEEKKTGWVNTFKSISNFMLKIIQRLLFSHLPDRIYERYYKPSISLIIDLPYLARAIVTETPNVIKSIYRGLKGTLIGIPSDIIDLKNKQSEAYERLYQIKQRTGSLTDNNIKLIFVDYDLDYNDLTVRNLRQYIRDKENIQEDIKLKEGRFIDADSAGIFENIKGFFKRKSVLVGGSIVGVIAFLFLLHTQTNVTENISFYMDAFVKYLTESPEDLSLFTEEISKERAQEIENFIIKKHSPPPSGFFSSLFKWRSTSDLELKYVKQVIKETDLTTLIGSNININDAELKRIYENGFEKIFSQLDLTKDVKEELLNDLVSEHIKSPLSNIVNSQLSDIADDISQETMKSIDSDLLDETLLTKGMSFLKNVSGSLINPTSLKITISLFLSVATVYAYQK